MRRPGPDVLDPKIHHANLLNSILAKIEANVAGADDALMLDGRGFVAETNATHLFAVVDGALVTPHTVACPEGITRQTVLDLAPGAGLGRRCATCRWPRCTPRTRCSAPARWARSPASPTIDGRPIGDGVVGPVTAADGRDLPGARAGDTAYPVA